MSTPLARPGVRRAMRAAGLLAIVIALAGASIGAAAAAVTPTSPGRSAASGRPLLHVIPFPDTPDASSRSHIIFSSLKRSDFRGLPIVRGSHSGPHTGHLTRLPDHAGTAFVPDTSFRPGERVTVRATLTSATAGTASGDPNATSLAFSFTVAKAVPLPGTRSASATRSAREAATSHRSFHSRPHLEPPPVHVASGRAPGRGDIFLTPRANQAGPMILNPYGQLVWFRPMAGEAVANDLEVEHYHGRPVLTWWQGELVAQHSAGGEDVILNQSYRHVATVRAGWGYYTNQHDFQLTPQGTALVEADVPVQTNLSGVGGPAHGQVLDFIVQELDIRTGTVLWEWHALGHVPLRLSHWRRPRSGLWDAYHLNSIQQLPGQRLLISFRNTWSVSEIDERTGRVIWTLGGKHPTLRMGPGTGFEWQHDARLNGSDLLTVFDDADGPQEEPQSSAKELRLNLRAGAATLVHRYVHSPPLLANVMGSTQLLEDHQVFVGWGSAPDFSQYTARGRQVFNATFPIGVKSYRAYRFAWTGEPSAPPELTRSTSGNGTTSLYVSWNGDTRTASWAVLGGSTPRSLRRLRVVHRAGFETAIRMSNAPHYLSVEALDSHGQVLGRSAVAAG